MLPALRTALDFMPSPIEDQPGLVIRDPFQYSDATLIIPPALVPALMLFDSQHEEAELQKLLSEITGDEDSSALAAHLTETLSSTGFFDDEAFQEKKRSAEQQFASAAVRTAAHAGGAYPEQLEELSETLRGYLSGATRTERKGTTRAIAAPHVSPFGGIASYRAAYSALTPDDAERTFVVLGTSHYGPEDRFGLTRKTFRTPFGNTVADLGLIDELEAKAPGSIGMEDYCHAIEHSIEFQVVFLQHLYGPRIKVVPILCGPFSAAYGPGLPEQTESNARMFDALGEIAAREGDRLCWILGVDMAHMGQRYGDHFAAHAGQNEMQQVEQLDQQRIATLSAGDHAAFWDLVATPLAAPLGHGAQTAHEDSLKWCGSSPIYTFLKTSPESKAELLHYEQWNIDETSVVSFAGMRFFS